MNPMRRSCLIMAAGAVFLSPQLLFAAAQSISRRPVCAPVGLDGCCAADSILHLVSRWLAERNSPPSIRSDRRYMSGSGVPAAPREGAGSAHAQARRPLTNAQASATQYLRCWASRRPVVTLG